jgi:two-component system sensor histidine kinase KdpD
VKRNPKTSELVENIQHEGELLSRQIQNLLETTRLESGALNLKKELYPLEDVVGTALDRLAKTIGNREVTVDIDEELPPIPVDGLLLEQVFVNLLENAIRHTSKDASISITAKKDGHWVLVSVADHGQGLNPEELDRIFEKFFHGKSSGGAGLGLAICRGIVNAHGGKIWAENAASGGAIFRFTLPLGHS